MRPLGLVKPLAALAPSYVGYGSSTTHGTQAIPYPAGTAAGDVALVYIYDSSDPGSVSTAGWGTTSFPALGGRLYRKVLTSGDLAATYTTNSAFGTCVAVWVFRGAAGVGQLGSSQTESSNGSESKSWTGANKTADTRAIIFLSLSAGGTLPTYATPALAGNMHVRNSVSIIHAALTYNFSPSEYSNNTNVQFNDYGTTWSQRGFVMLELT